MARLEIDGEDGVNYREFYAPGAKTFAYEAGNCPKSQRIYDVAWEDWYRFVVALMGYPQLKQSVMGPWIERVLPDPYPLKSKFAHKHWLYAAGFDIEGLGVDPDEGWDEETEDGNCITARVRMRYEPLTYQLKRDGDMPQRWGGPDESILNRFVTRVTNPNQRFLTIPRGAYFWVPDNVTVDNSAATIEASVNYTYTWHQVPILPDAVFTHLGCVNNAEFDGRAAGTLFTYGAVVKPYRWITGQRLYDVQWLIKQFEPEDGKGHNHFLRFFMGPSGPIKPPEYTLMTHNGQENGARVFGAKDFRDLFVPTGVDYD